MEPVHLQLRDLEAVDQQRAAAIGTLEVPSQTQQAKCGKTKFMQDKRRSTRLDRPVVSRANIPMRVIRRFARQVAERFHPEKIVLFGSYAYGTPHEDSDVDLLVVMPARNEIDAAIRIQTLLLPPFPLDLIVRKPKEVKSRLARENLS